MNQSFDVFSTPLDSKISGYPSPPTTASVSDTFPMQIISPSSSSESLLDVVPSYPAVAPPPSPTTSRLMSTASTRSTPIYDSRLYYKRGTCPEAILEIGMLPTSDESVTNIFFPPPGDEDLPGRQPGKDSVPSALDSQTGTSLQDTTSTLGEWSAVSTRPCSATRSGRATVASARAARRRSSARKMARIAALMTPSSVPVSSQSTRGTDRKWVRQPTVSSPLSSPCSSGFLSPTSRSPSPCASNNSINAVRDPFPEFNFFRRHKMLRQLKSPRLHLRFTASDESVLSAAMEEDELKKGKSEKDESEKVEEENKADEISGTETNDKPLSKKKRMRRRKPIKLEVSSEEQTVRDEISYLRNQYLPKVLEEVEGQMSPKGRKSPQLMKRKTWVSGTGATGSRLTSSGPNEAKLPAARPRDALLLRAGLLPPHLSPWRRALKAQLRAREAALLKKRAESTATRSRRSARTPLSRAMSPRLFSFTTNAHTPRPVPTTETILKPPRTASFITSFSLDADEEFVSQSQHSKMSVFDKSGGVEFYPVPSQVETVLNNIITKKSSECVLETRRLPQPLRAPEDARRWMSLLTTATLQRRAAEELRRRRRGEGAHEMWARRARQQPRPLVGSIFDRKPFFGAPGPNCNPLPWQN